MQRTLAILTLVVLALLIGFGSAAAQTEAGERPPKQQPGTETRAQAPALPDDLAGRQLAAGGDQDDGSDWLLYSRSYAGWRYSPLTAITKDNVADLQPAWSLATGMYDAFEASPVVVGGVKASGRSGSSVSVNSSNSGLIPNGATVERMKYSPVPVAETAQPSALEA